MNKSKIESENIIQKLKKPKFIENEILKTLLYVIGGVLGTIIVFFTQLIVNDKISLCIGIFTLCTIILITILISLVIVVLLYYIKNNELYRDYEKQYDYFTNQLDISNNKTNKKIKKIEKSMKDITDKQNDAIYYEEIGEIDEETGEVTYYDK